MTSTVQAQQLGNLNITMIDDSTRTVQLTAVFMLPAHTYFDEKGRSDIHFSYNTSLFLKKSQPPSIGSADFFKSQSSSKYRTDARFIPTDTDGVYRIETMTFHNRGNDVPPEWSFVGYSTDTTLLPVKVYDYYRQYAQHYTVYEPDQLEEQPYFTFDDTKPDFNKYILDHLAGSEIMQNMSGTVKFSFEVNSYGWAINFNVDEIDLRPKKEFVRLNIHGDINFGKQIEFLFTGINSMTVAYGFHIRHDNRFWTPGKINGEYVASKQYLTFNFE